MDHWENQIFITKWIQSFPNLVVCVACLRWGVTDDINISTSKHPEDNVFTCPVFVHVTPFELHWSSITGEKNQQPCPTASQNEIFWLSLVIWMRKVNPDPDFLRFVGISMSAESKLAWTSCLKASSILKLHFPCISNKMPLQSQYVKVCFNKQFVRNSCLNTNDFVYKIRTSVSLHFLAMSDPWTNS